MLSAVPRKVRAPFLLTQMGLLSALEGVAFNTRWLLKPVEKFLGRKVTSVNIVGGGAQSDIWCQIFSDVMNVEIKQVADPIYANAAARPGLRPGDWVRFHLVM